MRKTFYLAILMALLIGLLVPTAAFAGEAVEEQDWLCDMFGIGCEDPTPTPEPTDPPPEPTAPPIDALPPTTDSLVDVIIQTEGSTSRLVSFIRSLGGRINFEYKNVPAVAASVPASKMPDLSNFSDVSKIEKDRIFYLHDDLDGGKNDVHSMAYEVESTSDVEVRAVDLTDIDAGVYPEGYANFIYTGANQTWLETGFGEGSIVAVVDTGTAPNVCIGHAIIDAPGYPDGYNATGDGVPATSTTNHWHGTVVGGVIASACELTFTDPTDNLYQAIVTHLPWDPSVGVPVYGQAPFAQLYPVKVFPEDGSGSPTSVILDGLDHILTLKTEGLLDIDIVNMSLGGPTVWDGLDTFDRFLVKMAAENILVVTSAGNSGPIPNSMGSPATSFASLSVGALDYAPSSRVLYEYLGLRDIGLPGQGLVMRPTGETRVVNYSSHGPMSDGRVGVDIVALGHWNFHADPTNGLMWVGGTSFSSPTVAGGAALLNAYWEAKGRETSPLVLRNVLLRGADPAVAGSAWRDRNTQGHGALDVPEAFNLMKTRPWRMPWNGWSGRLRANILPTPWKGKVDSWESGTITLDPSESYDLVFEIGKYTSNVNIEVFDVVAPDNSSYAYWPNSLEVHLQSAKRTDWGDHPVQVYWYPYLFGDAFDIVVDDGTWTFWGIPWDYIPMEPGLMKLSLIGDYSNEAPVSFKVRVTRENFKEPLSGSVASGWIKMGDVFLVPVDVPEDAAFATFDLEWQRKWDKFPSSDIDMLIFDPAFSLYSFAGATGNAPERVVVADPAPGTWYVYIEGYEMYLPDFYQLFVTLE